MTAAGIDLAAYNTAESAADLDALRRALGYRQWNLFALSADGVLGLTYMRLFPGGIRSAVVDSGMSPQHLWGLDYYRGLNELLERVFAGCAANAACNAAYPNIRGVFFDLVHRLQAHPVAVPIPDFQPRPVTILVDGVVFYLDALFGIFPGDEDFPDTIRPLLSEIWRSAHGELTQVYQERLGTGPETSDADSFLAEGKTMSYVCRDLVGFITRADLRQAARDLPGLAPMFLDPDFDIPGSESHLTGGLSAVEGGRRRPGATPAGAQLDPDPGPGRRVRRQRATVDRAADPADAAAVLLLRVPGRPPHPAGQLQPGQRLRPLDHRPVPQRADNAAQLKLHQVAPAIRLHALRRRPHRHWVR